LRARRAARERHERRRDVLADDQFPPPCAGVDLLWKAQDERRQYAFLVREAALGSESVLAEEVTVVAQENDERIVEHAFALQQIEDRAHAFVDGGHHARAKADFLLLAGKNRLENRARSSVVLRRRDSAHTGLLRTMSST